MSNKLSSGVSQIVPNAFAFAALKSDGSVVSWAGSIDFGLRSGVNDKLTSDVVQITSTLGSFAALKGDGSLTTSGLPRTTEAFKLVCSTLSSGVAEIFANDVAFAALQRDGSVDIRESDPYRNSISRSWLSSDVLKVFANGSAFSALKQDGSVVSWGLPEVGGDSSRVADQLTSGVSEIITNSYAFAALKTDGAVVTWGHSVWGGDSSDVRSDLFSGVARIFANANSFAALKTDGSVVSWGGGKQFGQGPLFGDDSSEVAKQLRNGVVSFADSFSDDRLIPLTLPVITLSLAPASVTEDGLKNLLFTFTRTGPTTSALTVNFTVGGTATLGTDYTGIATTGTTKQVTFAAGSATATVVVRPTPDTTVEDDETVALTLANGTNYTIGTPSAVTGTIVNDDPPVITLALSPASVAEDGAASLIYTFSRTGPTTSALTVNFTVGGTATIGTDYTGIATTGTTKQVTFAAGSATATVIVRPTPDTTIEANETVSVTLASGTRYTIGTPSAVTGTIANDDTTLTLYNSSASTLPNQQGSLAFVTGLGTSTQTRSPSGNGTILNSTFPIQDLAGYSNRTAASTAPLVNSAFPSLDRNVGFRLDFRLSVLSETHLANVNNRAGFSVTLLDQSASPQGIELGFWTNSIFSQGGGGTPFQTVPERINNFATTSAISYSLRILDQRYVLLAGNSVVLTGSLQDYSKWPGDSRLPYNPYKVPNLLALGDNTSSASARVELGTVALGVALTGTTGADTFAGTADADSYNGLDGDDSINGAGGADWLAGGAGSDTLLGGAGDDLLIGGTGADRFFFSAGTSFNASQLGVDSILDFNSSEDRLRLARSTFTALPSGTSLASTNFAVVTTDAAAATSAAAIVYNSANGGLFYNPNGTAAGFAPSTTGGGLFAQLLPAATGSPFPTLTSGAFEIV